MFKATFKLLAVIALTTGVATSSLGADLKDPTRPYARVEQAVAAPAARFAVTAIFVSDNRRVAVVNGSTVTAGDQVSGATVKAITAHSVELRYRGKTIRARLDSTRVRE